MAFTDWVVEEQEVDTEVDTNVEEVDTEVQETPEQEENVEQETQTEPEQTMQTFNVNGQELTLEELQTGYMRQQDYISQREELNKLREENKQALELVDYLKKNPALAQKIMDEPEAENVSNIVNPAMDRIQALERQIFVQNLDNQISQLKSKYKDFNEVEVLNKAVQMGVKDLEFVYNGMRGANIETLIAQQVKEQLAQATENMKKNAQATRTVVGTTKETPVTVSHNLTQQEMRVADLMGMSYEDYAKYK